MFKAELASDPVLEEIRAALEALDVNHLTPVQAFQKFQQEQGGIFEKKQQEISAPIRQKVITAIESIAQKEGFTVVLEKNAAHYVAPENDLTFKVLDKLNIK